MPKKKLSEEEQDEEKIKARRQVTLNVQKIVIKRRKEILANR